MQADKVHSLSWRAWLLFSIAAAVIVGLALQGAISQDSAYHLFADRRGLWAIPNFCNVASNLPFIAAGLYGLYWLRRGRPGYGLQPLRPAYTVFFVSVCLVSAGSGYYHLDPSDATLVWDRLPMTVAFMAFFSLVLGEHVNSRLASCLLMPLLLLGVASVFWWWYSGDLRLYVLVQFLPFLLIPAIMLLYPSHLPGAAWTWAVLAAYVAAKLLELFDVSLYEALGISGHALKHVVSALGVCFVAVRLKLSGGCEPLADARH